MDTWRSTTATSPCIFLTSLDLKLTARTHKSRGEILLFRDSEYADDAATLFDSRSDASTGISELIRTFERFGMELHTGNPDKVFSHILFITAQ